MYYFFGDTKMAYNMFKEQLRYRYRTKVLIAHKTRNKLGIFSKAIDACEYCITTM